MSRKKVMKMKSVAQLLTEVKEERNREDKKLIEIQFEVRNEQVTMFFEYEKEQATQDNHYFIRHHHDPEFLDMETFELLKEALDDEGIRHKQRRDVFL